MINRFSVPDLHKVTIKLTEVANNKKIPDLIINNANILSTYTEKINSNKESQIENVGENKTEKVLCNHCGRTSSNGIRCIGICVSDNEY